jgi:hypothetical protein
MAAAGAVEAVEAVVHTGNTPEQIAIYETIYDYSLVGHQLEGEAKLWFGYHPRPEADTHENFLWCKWNDPRKGKGKGTRYFVVLGKCPILVRETGELALSPTVLRQRLYKGQDIKITEMFEVMRQAFLASVQPKVEPVVDVEAGVDVNEPTAAMEQMKLRDEGLTIGDILGVKVQPYAPGAKLTEVAKYGDKVVVAEEGELEKAIEMAAKILEKRDKEKKS